MCGWLVEVIKLELVSGFFPKGNPKVILLCPCKLKEDDNLSNEIQFILESGVLSRVQAVLNDKGGSVALSHVSKDIAIDILATDNIAAVALSRDGCTVSFILKKLQHVSPEMSRLKIAGEGLEGVINQSIKVFDDPNSNWQTN